MLGRRFFNYSVPVLFIDFKSWNFNDVESPSFRTTARHWLLSMPVNFKVFVTLTCLVSLRLYRFHFLLYSMAKVSFSKLFFFFRFCLILHMFPFFFSFFSCIFQSELFSPQNLPIGADCVGSLKLTYISKVSKNISTTVSLIRLSKNRTDLFREMDR